MFSDGSTEFIIMGAIFGFTAGISPGPLLALVITETIKHNKTEGIKVAISPLVTDLPVIALAFLFLTSFSHLNMLMGLISLIGGLFLLYLGYECFQTKGMSTDIKKSGSGSLLKGITANLLNPHPYLFWITVGIPVALKALNVSQATVILYFISFYFMLTGSKISVALLVDRSKAFLNNKIYLWIMRILGSLLFGFALLFFMDFVKNLKA